MKEYLKFRVWDWILCACIATGLVFALYSGFVLEDSFSSSIPRVGLFMLAAMAVLVLLTRNRASIIAGIIAGAVLLAVVVFYTHTHEVFGDEASETANSLFIAISVTVLAAVLVYLACRSRPGIIALFLAGNILICGAHFLQFPVETWSFLLFTFAVFAMFWYRNYMITIQHAQTGKIRLPRYMVQSLLVLLAAICIGGGAFYGIVKPLNPPTRELKLIEQMKQLTIVQKTGLYSVNELLDPNKESGEDPSQTDPGNQEEDEDEQGDIGSGEVGTEEGNQDQKLTPGERLEEAQEVYYILNFFTIPWLLLVIVLLITALFLLRMLSKRNWEKKVESLPPEQQIINYYTWIMKRLDRTGFKRPKNHTLYEYARDMDHELEEFRTEDVDFSDLTDIYVQTLYGRSNATEEQAVQFRQFYKIFYKKLRKEIGTIKYLINLFRI